MKKIAAVAGIITAMLLSGAPAHASHADWGYITDVSGMSNGAVLFIASGTRTTPPGCQHPGLPLRWAIDASTANGHAQLSMLLTAYAQHKRITIEGLATCSIWGDTETVNYFAIEG